MGHSNMLLAKPYISSINWSFPLYFKAFLPAQMEAAFYLWEVHMFVVVIKG